MPEYKSVTCKNADYEVEKRTKEHGAEGWRLHRIMEHHSDPGMLLLELVRD